MSGECNDNNKHLNDIYTKKPPTDVFDDVNAPISSINTTEINDIEKSSSYSFKNI